MKVLIVTGSVGTGKTTIARRVSNKAKFRYINVNKLINKHKITEGYDKKRKTKIIDVKRLNKVLVNEINQYKKYNKGLTKLNGKSKKHSNKKNKKVKIGGITIDSHLSHYLPKRYVDFCIVTKCDLKVLRGRLGKRRYSKAKIQENLDVEIFDICLNEAREKGHKIVILDTTRKANIDDIIKMI